MMGEPNRLRHQLEGIDGRDYAAYQSLVGKHDYSRFSLFIDQIPKDPYAPAHTGIYRARAKIPDTGLLDDMMHPPARNTALRDFLARAFFDNCSRFSKGRRGTGNSGLITIG